MRNFLASTAGIFSVCSSAYSLTLEQVLSSSATHYPKILSSLQKIESGDAEKQIAQGAFDWEVQQKIMRRSHTYDGRYADTQVTRRFYDNNMRLYFGYRISKDYLPSYEDAMNTYRGGEFNVGVMFSLLKDRTIDKDRYNVRQSELTAKKAQNEMRLTQLKTQYQAMNAYLEWIALGKSIQSMRYLLELSEKRQVAFEKKNKHGDIAEIYLTENQQYILKRQIEINQMEQEWQNSAVYLSLFWRDEMGNSNVPTPLDMPHDFPDKPSIDKNKLIHDMAYLQSQSPDIIAIDMEQSKLDNTIELGENSLLPKVDVVLEGTHNVGGQKSSPAGNDVKIGLSITIPLERNIAEGKIRKAEAEKNRLEYEQKLVAEQIATQLKTIASNYAMIEKYQNLISKEVALAEVMQQAEYSKFKEGLSDLFVVNLREEKTIEAQLKLIKAQLDFWKNISNYYFSTMNYSSLYIKQYSYSSNN
ncbi:TolC family protein [Azomonas macrocytogenes]|uniref:Outer membrane protein TolC n=1 Tax=Azomonas macrocytogenes TaxID=69962 RepID=A0A839T9N6_AZOMA|nr:TolC family protein [Azomonas macrocytogenes]MBB3104904.1 outer membrane protein TolC [Azomonas macrocytogenes]